MPSDGRPLLGTVGDVRNVHGQDGDEQCDVKACIQLDVCLRGARLARDFRDGCNDGKDDGKKKQRECPVREEMGATE